MARKLKNLSERNKFYILTNGEQTETIYFNLLKSKYHSIYDIKVKFFNDDPLQLVQHAQDFLLEANQVWCVFDIDFSYEEGNLIPALKLADKTGVNIAFSNKSFEVWLISHYKKCSSEMSNTELISELNKILKKENNTQNKIYQKSDKKLLEQYFIPRYEQAITNCKIVHQKFIKDYNAQNPFANKYKIWEWNPCSNIYELIEELQLNNYEKGDTNERTKNL